MQTMEERVTRLETTLLSRQLLKFKLEKEAFAPQKSEVDSIGWDVRTPIAFSLLPLELKRVPIGIYWEPPEGFHAIMKERSGLANRGVEIHGGVIDSSYRGEWMVVMRNSSDSLPQTFAPGDKIAQFIVLRESLAEVLVVPELGQTARGAGGFGSTDRIARGVYRIEDEDSILHIDSARRRQASEMDSMI